jgi:dihydrofolate reductase
MVRYRTSVSLDGFIAGPDPSEADPLGVGGEALHEWALKLAIWREAHGKEGGEVNESTVAMQAQEANVGAEVMGRGMFGGGGGDWGAEPWSGWWGDDPPFRVPVFVLTHHEREALELGETTFSFVTDGIESCLDQAKAAAGGRDVLIGGGADTARQFLAAGLVDEMHVNLVPILLGSGTDLWDGLAAAGVTLEQTSAIGAPDVTHLSYRPALSG